MKQFTAHEGLWMSLMIGPGMLGMLLLWLLEFFRLN